MRIDGVGGDRGEPQDERDEMAARAGVLTRLIVIVNNMMDIVDGIMTTIILGR